jgi:16S rRNA (guanine527-N7)-methyltransferase
MSTSREGGGEPLSLQAIAATLAPFCASLSDRQVQDIKTYAELLLKWNKSINLTAIEDPVEILVRHFGESIFPASFLKIGARRLADVGTGAGFPGLPLKIVCPEMELALFEANAKKCAFLVEVIQRLELTGIAIIRERYEGFQESGGAGFDFVCSRALGDYHVFLPWSRRVLKYGGRIVLWLGTDESIRLGRRKEFFWDAPVAIPESRRRVILVGRRASPATECST